MGVGFGSRLGLCHHRFVVRRRQLRFVRRAYAGVIEYRPRRVVILGLDELPGAAGQKLRVHFLQVKLFLFWGHAVHPGLGLRILPHAPQRLIEDAVVIRVAHGGFGIQGHCGGALIEQSFTALPAFVFGNLALCPVAQLSETLRKDFSRRVGGHALGVAFAGRVEECGRVGDGVVCVDTLAGINAALAVQERIQVSACLGVCLKGFRLGLLLQAPLDDLRPGPGDLLESIGDRLQVREAAVKRADGIGAGLHRCAEVRVVLPGGARRCAAGSDRDEGGFVVGNSHVLLLSFGDG